MSKTHKSTDKALVKVSEPETSPMPETVVEKAPAKAVKAVFVPVGQIKVHLDTPSGNEYNLVPCETFTIAAEDVDWFFNEWDWGFRQRLTLEKDYKPTCGYHDTKAGEKDYHPEMKYDDPFVGAAKAPVDAEADSKEKE